MPSLSRRQARAGDGDPVDGKFRILATDDSGRSWSVLLDDGMPEAATEYGFAASGDCLVTAGRTAYFGSGGGVARVFRSTDFGLTWTASNSTIPAGGSAVATTRDGSTAHHAGDLAHLGEDAAYLPGRGHRLIVTGESGEVMGASVSADGGRSWTQVSETGFHALDCTRDGSCWAAGAGGRVARLTR